MTLVEMMRPLARKLVVDRTYFKLRQLALSYVFPDTALGDMFDNVRLTLYGRNLILWTPKEQYFIDPEVNSFGTGQEGEFGEFYNTPSSRDVGLRLNVTF